MQGKFIQNAIKKRLACDFLTRLSSKAKPQASPFQFSSLMLMHKLEKPLYSYERARSYRARSAGGSHCLMMINTFHIEVPQFLFHFAMTY